MVILALPLIAAIIGLFALGGGVEAHHNGVPCGPGGDAVCLPGAPTFVQQAMQTVGEVRWCVDQRASTYPNFVAQIHETMDAGTTALGIGHQQIAGIYNTPAEALTAGCFVLHSMPDNHACEGCAAWVFYANWPVLIEYKWQVGYTFWNTTIGHEMGHVYGLHEHYDDVDFIPYRPTYGHWAHGDDVSPGTATDAPTVMDVGTGIWALTSYDVDHICDLNDPDGDVFLACAPPAPTLTPALLQLASCRDGRIPVEFNWAKATSPNGAPIELLFLDLSVSDNGFQAGTYFGVNLSANPDDTRLEAGSPGEPLGTLVAEREHFWRVNSRIAGVWIPSATGSFTTQAC